jgi:thiamine biosynthesis protein ThiS
MLNGDRFELPGPMTVGDLLRQLNIDCRRVAVEHNLIVLRRGAFDTTPVTEGDCIEVVNFVGGGSGIRNVESAMWNSQPEL